ncbi:hypothetical protein AB0H34_35525 [Saccharopolyspora shandongensis]|uniref:hypothetical protein n=1 Tax=Saccharopolyspora shandongensis TaxID=418495 RepID=UPI0033C736D6
MADPNCIHMKPEDFEHLSRVLTAVGEDMQTGWNRRRAAIEASESRIGRDPLGSAFRREYGPARESVVALADPLPGRWLTQGKNGTDAVALYFLAQQDATGCFPR